MKRFTIQNPKEEIRHYKTRVIVVGGFITILLCALIFRLVYLQIVQHEYYLTLSEQNLLSVAPIDPGRGLIYDRNGALVAGNIPVFSLEVIPDKVKNIQQTISQLSKFITLTPTDLQEFEKQRAQGRKFDPIPLKVKLTDEEIAAFSVNQYQFPGVSVNAHLLRYYPYGALLEPVLGYVGRINSSELEKVDESNYSATNYIGKSGIEKYYETQLHGTVGIQQIETSASGQVIRANKNRPAVAGENLYISIDLRLQKIAQKALEGQSGAVVAIDPRNGEVLALVSNPGFDPNQFVEGVSAQYYKALQDDPEHPLFNRAMQGQFPTGSAIKPFYALGALANGVLSATTRFFCPGYFMLPGNAHVYHCWKRRGHGSLTVEQAIIQSCDVFFWHVAQNSGIDRMDTVLRMFGFGSPTGIDSYSERSGLIPSPEWKRRVHHDKWYGGDTIAAGVGQGYFLVTPLQLANALMRMVDKGGGYQLHLLVRQEKPTGDSQSIVPKALPKINNVPDTDWDLVLRAMREVVSDPRGTGYHAGLGATFTFGGKSGTAQVYDLHGAKAGNAKSLPKNLRDHTWFISFAPADNPSIVMVVFIENGGEGQATYMARNIYQQYFQENIWKSESGQPKTTL